MENTLIDIDKVSLSSKLLEKPKRLSGTCLPRVDLGSESIKPKTIKIRYLLLLR
jgi:hypothetical protein